MPDRAPRSYRSSIKRGEAAPAVLAAAARLFAERGYLATSIDDIARAASVARPTVFAAVGTKPAIFRAVLEAAVAGDRPVVPVVEQPWFRAVVDEPDPRRMLRSYARNVRLIGERISALYWAAECAAETDDAVRELWQAVEGERIETSRIVARTLAARTRLRADYDAQSAGEVLVTIVSPASWRSLVRDRGWSPDRFEKWAGDTMCRLLLPGR